MPFTPVPVIPKLEFERYADISLAAGASYTPTVSGLFHASGAIYIAYGKIQFSYRSDLDAAWYPVRTEDYTGLPVYGNPIGDGTNLMFYNATAAAYTLVLMRMGYSKPNPSPKVGRQTMYGTNIIVLESDEKGFIWIEEEMLASLCEDVIPEVREAKEKSKPHPLIGKAFTQAIKEDVEDKMGYGKYKSLLRDLGFDV